MGGEREREMGRDPHLSIWELKRFKVITTRGTPTRDGLSSEGVCLAS